MSNLTLSIDDKLLQKARIRALEQGTSVNAVVRRFLEAYAGLESTRKSMEAFVAIADGHHAGRRSGGRTWRRQDLYEDRIG